MDDKILGALNNISNAIEEIAKYTKSKSKEAAKTLLHSIDMGKKVESIRNSIKEIKKDTEKILQEQKTLLQISREKNSKSSIFETASNRASKVKDGVNLILLIAGGVLAIGLAFKIIGQVDFASVIALSIAMPLVAFAFEKIANLKGLKGADMKSIFLTILTMSTALTLSSWILKFMSPITFKQAATGILISGMFYVITLNIEKLRNAVKGISYQEVLAMSGVLLAISATITVASWLLYPMAPLSFGKALTGIMISGMFYAVTLNIEKLRNAVKGITYQEVFAMSGVLLAITATITMASWLLYPLVPISIGQALTGILIAGMFYVVTLNIEKLRNAVKGITIKEMASIGGVLLAITATIVLSSWILQGIAPMTWQQGLTAIAVSLIMTVAGIALGSAAAILSKIGIQNILMGGVAIVALAGVMAISSWVLSIGKYDKFPTLEWAAGVGLSLVAFGLSAIVLGTIAISGIGALALLAGGAAILGVAGVVVATSYILAAGKYGTYPTLAWSSGVAISMTAFGLGMTVLGSMILGSFGLGFAVLAAGSAGMLIVAQSIVDTSDILRRGNYTGGPTKEWAEGISLALGTFAPIFKVLFDRGIIGLFTKGPSAKDFADAITTVSNGIVIAGKYFMGVPNIWNGGPTAEWAGGIGGALAAFTPVFDALAKSSGLFGSGPTPEDMAEAMIKIAHCIVEVGKYFMTVPDIWKGGPTVEWSNGIAGALTAFAPIFDYLDKNSHWYGNDDFDAINQAVVSIAHAIVESAKVLNKGIYNNVIPAGYIQSISDNIRQYVDLLEYLQSKNVGAFSFIDTLSITYGLTQLSQGYDKLSKSIKLLGNSINALDLEKLHSLKSLTGNVVLLSLMDSDQLEKVLTAYENKGGIFVKLMQDIDEKIEKTKYGTIGSVRNTNTNEGTDTQILTTLRSIDGKMGQLVINSKSLSELMEEFRHSKSNSLTDKKHY